MLDLTTRSAATREGNCPSVGTASLLCTVLPSILQSALLTLLLLAAPAHAQSTAKPQFIWKQDSDYRILERVRFANGEIAIVNDDPKPSSGGSRSCFGRRLEIGKEGALRPQGVCDSIVHIQAAYPSATDAKVAIVAANCGGTMCGRYSDYFVVFIGEHGLRTAAIGTGFYAPKDRPTTYEFWFDGSRIARSIIRNFFDGAENELGDLLPSTRNFAKPGFYLDSRFKPQYAKFVGEHPESVLSDETVRAGIVRSLDPASFRAYRSAMSGPGSSTVANGRFVVMNACMAHFCNSEFGSVVLDGFTGDIRLLRFDVRTKAFFTSSTRPFDESRDWRWIEAVEMFDAGSLVVASGKLRVEWK